MNIFACDADPVASARALPDKHVVKMCIENAQMLAVAFGDPYGLGWGTIRKKDGSPYGNRGYHNHPSSIWVRSSFANLAWTIVHGLALCHEYTNRYGKTHAAVIAHMDAKDLFHRHTDWTLNIYQSVNRFARAMPEYIKHDRTIDDVQAYRKYLTLEKPWAVWKMEDRKPTWWDPQLYTDAVDHGVPRALQDGRKV